MKRIVLVQLVLFTLTALIVAQAAWENKQSMGAHYRE